jgi:asparagine synthase (glutamine-hydrolysing)
MPRLQLADVCGICGILSFDGSPGDASVIARMNRTLVHRGPDDEGIHVGPSIALGERRLSIIDLSSAATAPLSNEDRTVWVVFNGEIYNFQELRTQLTDRGHRFRTGTDTEVVVHLYEEYGIACLTHLRGMFAFAVWDAVRGQLFAARDRFGKKPLVYAKTASAIVFGSEIKAVTAHPAIAIEPHYAAIDAYLTYQYVPSPLTAFVGINKLPPAHFLLCTTSGEIRVERYWSPPAAVTTTTASVAELEAELLRQLREAVRLRMVSDVPLGAFLSGGVDSSSIVALMAQESTTPVRTFSIGFQEEAYNELPFARLVAQRYGTEHHEHIVTPQVAEVLPTLVKHYNEPFADSSAVPTFYLSKLTREHVTVALSGDGGDEAFSGYGRYGQVARWERTGVIPRAARRFVATVASSVLDRLPYRNTTARVARAFAMLGGALPERYLLAMTVLKPQEQRVCYTREFQGLLERERHPPLTLPWSPEVDGIDWMMQHDRHFYLPDCLMVKTDIASMANSLEVRSPMLDHVFMEFSATIPSSLKRNGSGGKKILKSAVRSLVPEPVINRRKAGFGLPVGPWFRTAWAEPLRELVLDDRATKRGLFNRDALRRMVDDQVTGRRDWSDRLWSFTFLESWFREFID